MQLLLENGSDYSYSEDIHNTTPLSYATQNGHLSIVKLFEMQGAENTYRLQSLYLDSEYDGRSSLSDQDDIASIFSAGSLPSSQSSLSEVLSVAIYEFANLLLTDAELMLLYPTAITKVGLDKFQRNFARFFKRYGQSLEAEASNEMQHQAAQFVRRSARRTAVEMGRELKRDDEDFHELRGLDIEVPKLTQVNKWLELRKNDHREQHAEVLDQTEDHDISDESDSDGSESSEPALRTLEEVKEFMTLAPAFLHLREEFELGLNLIGGITGTKMTR